MFYINVCVFKLPWKTLPIILDHSIYTDYDSYIEVDKDKLILEVKNSSANKRQPMEYYDTFFNALKNLHIFDFGFVGKYKDEDGSNICLRPF